jgi:hypothetical protein
MPADMEHRNAGRFPRCSSESLCVIARGTFAAAAI